MSNLLVDRRRMMKIPFKEIEWIQSTGMQRIFFQNISLAPSRVEFSAAIWPGNTTPNPYRGWFSMGGPTLAWFNTGNIKFYRVLDRYGSAETTYTSNLKSTLQSICKYTATTNLNTRKMEITAELNGATVLNLSFTATAINVTATTFFCFSKSLSNATVAKFEGHIVYYDANNNIIAEFVPCIANNGDVGFYEKITRTFETDWFGNGGFLTGGLTGKTYFK